VRQLRGGEFVSATLDELRHGVRPQRWYTLALAFVNGRDAAAAYRELLDDSVRLRLRADVPVGSCLSGGLDSSSIVCLANRQLRAAGAESVQRTFSARSSDPRFDEGRFIDAVVRHTGVANSQVDPPLEALFRELPALTWHQDEPFGSTSIYAQWHVFRLAAAHGVKVMLDGQGADEQLAGYASFVSARFSSLLRQGRFADFLRETRAVGANQRMSARELAARAVSLVLPDFVRQQLRRMVRRSATLGEDWIDLARLRAEARNPEIALGGTPTNVLEMSVSQVLHTSLPMLLHWEDRDSMAHSIEARVPFLDYRLVELTLGLPEECKLALGVSKGVLRDAMHGILPEEIRNRLDKIGFATAEEQWLKAGAPDAFRAAMREAEEASHGILRPQASAMLEDFIAGRRPFNFLPWRAISLGAWMRRFDVQPG
jgi:asparagine synthase (glutamine-hydrolysing)